MLNTTQNTRELGGYQTVYGVPTREMTAISSDVQNYPDEEDCLFLKSNGITTIIDMRGTKDVLKKVTEPFYMADKSRSRKAGGAGLGLSLCVEIAKRHGARLTAKSKPGVGTSIFIIRKSGR